VSFAALTLCVASQPVFIFTVVVVYFVMTQSGNFWIPPVYAINVFVNDIRQVGRRRS
jgi:hypothetical protein